MPQFEKDSAIDAIGQRLSYYECIEIAKMLEKSYFTNPAQDIRVEYLNEAGLISIKKQDNKLLLSASPDDRDLTIAKEILKWVAFTGLTAQEALQAVEKLEKMENS
jgi:hypothetical protein